MKKVILVDGNNLLFRSYYATAYTGNIMKNKEGFPTNALYGFVNMINKIINEEEPKYMMVAFDIGKTFRHESYEDYKGGREATPDDLKKQFPVAKKILTAMGIKYFELEGYEADDIIGTFAKEVDVNDDFIATIVSSDKDLLQLISDDVEVKLLKSKDYIRMDKVTFKETYGLDPIKMIDLKALMGDSSDNIPGVKGIGEKTAIKLLQEYDNLDNLYNNLDNLSSSVKTKLSIDKDNAYMSRELATINKAVPMEINLDDITYNGEHSDELIEIFNDLEFYSFLKKMDNPKKGEIKKEDINYKVISNLNELDNIKESSLYIELNNDNYHNADIVGISVFDGNNGYYIPSNLIDDCKYFNEGNKYTYDLKRLYVSLKKRNIIINNVNFDTMIGVYLLNYNVKSNIEELMNKMNYEISFIDKNASVSEDEFIRRSILKAKFIYNTKNDICEELEKDNLTSLYNDIEHPLSIILGDMEYEGIRVDKNVLNEMKEELKIKIELISKDIYNYAGEEFNISSVKQLGYILFDKLKLPVVKKTKTGYSTDNSVLEKLKSGYPIVEKILE